MVLELILQILGEKIGTILDFDVYQFMSPKDIAGELVAHLMLDLKAHDMQLTRKEEKAYRKGILLGIKDRSDAPQPIKRHKGA